MRPQRLFTTEGVVLFSLFRHDEGRWQIKRMLRVLNPEGNRRLLLVAPHSAKRYHSPADRSNSEYNDRCSVYDQLNEAEKLVDVESIPTLLAA
jgi:hypothetical protein